MQTAWKTLLTGGILLVPQLAWAQSYVSPETQFILSTLLLLIGGFLVMFMAAGFCLLEAGLVRATSVSTICVKNIGLYAIAGLMYFLVGYHLMYSGVEGGYIGTLSLFLIDDSAFVNLDGRFVGTGGVSSAASWFFQMVFVATTASIVSGTIAERARLWPFLLFVAVLCGGIYPVAGSWLWGQGWLDMRGFKDFAGSTLVHSVGGWAALVAVLMIGPRKGRFDKLGRSLPMPASSIPLAAAGTFILWLGWFGFNGASQLSLASAMDASAIARIFANTNIAAAAGVITAMLFTQLVYRKVDPTLVFNGALAGLVSITAGPLSPSLIEAALIGAAGGLIMLIAVPMLDKCRIDDVVGAIPVHLLCGIWGTLAVPLTDPSANFMVQLTGIVAYGGFTVIASLITWLVLKFCFGLRISDEEAAKGIDQLETGIEAYPDFVKTTLR